MFPILSLWENTIAPGPGDSRCKAEAWLGPLWSLEPPRILDMMQSSLSEARYAIVSELFVLII